MTLTKQSPAAVRGGNRAIEANQRAAIEDPEHSAPAVSLQVEAAQFSKAKRKQKGSPGRFTIEPDGPQYWKVCAYPVKGMPTVIRGLTYPQAHREGRQFSDAGFEGLVIGGPRYV